MRYRLRTLMIVLAVGPPLLAVTVLLLMSPSTRFVLLDLITFAAFFAALAWLWESTIRSRT